MHPMTELPSLITSFVDFRVSLGRIQEFLQSKEIDIENLINKEKNDTYSVQIHKHSFSWGSSDKPETLDQSKSSKAP